MAHNFLFKRESNDFSDILNDTNIKKEVCLTMTFDEHLILGIEENSNAEKVKSYILLKYGEDLINFGHVIPDRSPVAGKDYMPERKKKVLH